MHDNEGWKRKLLYWEPPAWIVTLYLSPKQARTPFDQLPPDEKTQSEKRLSSMLIESVDDAVANLSRVLSLEDAMSRPRPSALESKGGEMVAGTPRKKRTRPKTPCFEAAVQLLRNKPGLTLIEFCREMDRKAEQYPTALKYKPPVSWSVKAFYDQYQKRPNTVSRFVSDARRELKTRERD